MDVARSAPRGGSKPRRRYLSWSKERSQEPTTLLIRTPNSVPEQQIAISTSTNKKELLKPWTFRYLDSYSEKLDSLSFGYGICTNYEHEDLLRLIALI